MINEQVHSAAAAGTFSIGGALTVNRLGYGAMRITGPGIWGPPADKDAALATLRRAVDLDVNLIDTADSYGPAVSEELIAEALYPYPSGLVIATKGGWERPGPGQWTHNAGRKHPRGSVRRQPQTPASGSHRCISTPRSGTTQSRSRPQWKHWPLCASRVRLATSDSRT